MSRAASLLLLLAAAAPARAQEAEAPQSRAASERKITVQNVASYPRDEWFCAVVPFPRGEVHDVPDLHVEERVTVWQPFGARWPDGSLRQALCLFHTQLPQNRSAQLALREGPGPEHRDLPWQPVPADLEIHVQRGDAIATAQPQLVETLEENEARHVKLLRCRVADTGLVCEVIVEEYAAQEHCWIDVALFFSDPTTTDMQRHYDRVTVTSRGAAMLLRHPGPLAVQTRLVNRGTDVALLVNQTLGDGQGIRRTGVLVPPLRGGTDARDQTLLAAAQWPPLAATDWRASGAFGPFGYVPDPPPWLRGPALTASMQRRHQRFVQLDQAGGNDPFRNFELGLAKEAGQTGDQEEFGVVKMEPVAATGMPSFLLEAELSVLQEACRPVHFFEADGAPVLASKHPDWVVWSGRTHWHCDMSKDRLGKPCPVPEFETHKWTGKDREHWSSLYLCGYYLLTGKHWALREIENEVQLFLGGETVDPKVITSGPGAPRAAGRTLLTGCWLYQCTGDADLLARMHQRMNRVLAPSFSGKDRPIEQVRTFQVQNPDPRILQGSTKYWTPWQDAIAAVGFAAFHRMSGNPTAGALGDAVAKNLVRYGWLIPQKAPPIIASSIRWQDDGAPLSPEEIARGDAKDVEWSYGTAFSEWAIGAVEIARQAAVRDGETELARRAEFILTAIRAKRTAPKDGWFDRFGEWDGVR